jgi:hypothetical protein
VVAAVEEVEDGRQQALEGGGVGPVEREALREGLSGLSTGTIGRWHDGSG